MAVRREETMSVIRRAGVRVRETIKRVEAGNDKKKSKEKESVTKGMHKREKCVTRCVAR